VGCQIFPACNCYSVAGDVSDSIKIEELELFARVGVTENERANPQRLTLTITVWPRTQFEALEDDIGNTTNYSAICAVARDFARSRTSHLIETLVTELASELLRAFPIEKVRLELRKFVLPDAKHVAVIVTRTRSGK
jgi:dihydroneopterin aldolase